MTLRPFAEMPLALEPAGPVAIAASDEFVAPARFQGEREVLETMIKRYVSILLPPRATRPAYED